VLLASRPAARDNARAGILGSAPGVQVYHTSFQEYLCEEVDPGLKTYQAMIARAALTKVGTWKEGKG
jgi:hypothetical protein